MLKFQVDDSVSISVATIAENDDGQEIEIPTGSRGRVFHLDTDTSGGPIVGVDIDGIVIFYDSSDLHELSICGS